MSVTRPVVAVGFFPAADLLVGFVASAAVFLLDLAHELVALAADGVELVVGQLAPLFLDRSLELLPVAFDAIPVHGSPFRMIAVPVGCRRPMAVPCMGR